MIEQAKGTRLAYLSNCLRTYSCVYCRAHLANHDELISKQFLGTHGPAYLFNSVVNVGIGASERRSLSTGPHVVADIYCNNCKTTLGWKYEQAFVVSQKYKEGKYIIELAHMLKENDWDLTSYNAKSIYNSHAITDNLNGLQTRHQQRFSTRFNNYYYYNYYHNNNNYDILIRNNLSVNNSTNNNHNGNGHDSGTQNGDTQNGDNQNGNNDTIDSSQSSTQSPAISINNNNQKQSHPNRQLSLSPSSTSQLSSSSSCSPSSSSASSGPLGLGFSTNVTSCLESPSNILISDEDDDDDNNDDQDDDENDNGDRSEMMKSPIHDHDTDGIDDSDNNNIDYDIDLNNNNTNNNINESNNNLDMISSSYSAVDEISQNSNGDHFYDCYSDNETMAIDDNLVMITNTKNTDKKLNDDHHDDR